MEKTQGESGSWCKNCNWYTKTGDEIGHQNWCKELPTNELLQTLSQKVDRLCEHLGIN
jgi:hypothetical protein